jgi:hypothetical protein
LSLQACVAKALLTPLGGAFACHKVRRNSMPARAILIAFVFAVSNPAIADCREPETGDDVSGWVSSSRLKETGTVGH